jgi:quercetin dioxygenase-like cupin family protein
MELYSWSSIPHRKMAPLIMRQIIHTPSLTMTRIEFKQGAAVGEHHHVNEQVTSVVSGKLSLTVEGSRTILGPGDIIRLPSDVPHAAEALEDTVVIDVFTPARSDL